jgi:hypothetical protein
LWCRNFKQAALMEGARVDARAHRTPCRAVMPLHSPFPPQQDRGNRRKHRQIVAATLYYRAMRYLLCRALVALAFLAPIALAAADNAAPVSLRILAVNDFHGYLHPPPGGIRISDPDDRGKKIAVAAGGSETMATLVKELRRGQANTVFVAAGDLIGASPFLSAMFHDEPTIESLSMMGLRSRPSAITNSTRARTNCCGCRTEAATRLTNAWGRIPSLEQGFRAQPVRATAAAR